jgi:hypothetical protein
MRCTAVIQFLRPCAAARSVESTEVPTTHMSKSEPPKVETADEALANKPGAPSGAEAYARWLEHMQRTRTRHAAITRNLYTWSNYKSWADKMRVDWKDDSKP